MIGCLTVHEQAKIVARYEVWTLIVLDQIWWREGKGKYATVSTVTITGCHAKLVTTGSMNDAGSGRPTTSRSVEIVATVREMFNRNPQKSTGQAVYGSELTGHTICTVLHKEVMRNDSNKSNQLICCA